MGISLSNKHKPCIALRCLLLTVLLAFVCCSCPAQSSLLDKKMSLSNRKYTIYELCNAIEKQIDASVSYNSAKIKSSKKISISTNATDLRMLLGVLKNDYNIDCNIIGNHIILTPAKGFTNNRPRHRQRKKKEIKQKAIEDKQKAAKPVTEKINKALQADSGSNVTFIDADTSKNGALPPPNGAGGSVGNVNYESEPTSMRRWGLLKENLITGVSAYASQPYYFNMQAELGFKYVYFSAAYAFKGNNLGHWRLGGGFSFPVFGKMNAGLYTNYGNNINSTTRFSYETTEIIPSPDSPVVVIIEHNGTVDIEQNLFKVGIAVDYKINSFLNIFISPCFNSLNTGYYHDGALAALRSLIPLPVAIREEDFQPLHTGLNINNNFDPDVPSYRKAWISISVGLRIGFLAK